MENNIKKILGEILTSIKSLEKRVTLIESKTPSMSTPSHDLPIASKKMSIKEFLIDRSPANGVQTTLAVAYYLEKYDKISPFNASDIEKAFRSAKEPVPNNINDKANMCIKNGHLMEGEDKKDNMKAWVVTRSGEQYVQEKFDRYSH